MHKRILAGLGALALGATMVLPVATSAKTKLPKLTTTHAIDEKGDANAIGVFNSEHKNTKRRVVSGTVTAVSSTSITVQVGSGSSDSNSNTNTTNSNSSSTVKTYTFTVDTNTKVIRKYKGTATINEVAVGDKVQVWGTALTNGTAKLIWDKSIWYAEVSGKVSNLNTTTSMFTFVVTMKGVQYTTTVKYDSMTTFLMKDGTTTTSAAVANGQTVKVRGAWNTVGSYLLAKRLVIMQ